MPRSYGIEFRKKIVECYLNKEGGIRKLAKRFKVGTSTVQRIIKRYQETGEFKLYLHRGGRREIIDEAGRVTLQELLLKEPDLTLSEIQEKYFAIRGKKPVLAVFHRVLKKMNFKHKKKSHFAEQQLHTDIKKARRIH